MIEDFNPSYFLPLSLQPLAQVLHLAALWQGDLCSYVTVSPLQPHESSMASPADCCTASGSSDCRLARGYGPQLVPRRRSVLTLQLGDRLLNGANAESLTLVVYLQRSSGQRSWSKQMSPFKWDGRVPEPRHRVDMQPCLLVCYLPYGFPQSVLALLVPSQKRERERAKRGNERYWARLLAQSGGASLVCELTCSVPPSYSTRVRGAKEMTRQGVVENGIFTKLNKIHSGWVRRLQQVYCKCWEWWLTQSYCVKS